MAKNTDGYSQAFPFSSTDYYDERPIGSSEYFGLTKREYFAAMALQGLLAAETENYNFGATETGTRTAASEAVAHADALIAALNGEGQADA